MMVTRYSIIQYVPDPIAGERINFGVIVFDDEQIRVQFLDSWKRVNCFGSENIDFLRDFVCRIKISTTEGLFVPGEDVTDRSKSERLSEISASWQSMIQITPPRKFLGEIESVLDEVAAIFLKEPLPEAKPTFRDRKAAARITKVTVREVLNRRFDPDLVRNLLNSTNAFLGRRESHQFDATVINGRPYFGVHGVSFEIHPPKTTTEAVSWMISDVRDRTEDVPLAVLVLPPKPGSFDYKDLLTLYTRKTELYQELGATVLEELELEPWAEKQLEVAA